MADTHPTITAGAAYATGNTGKSYTRVAGKCAWWACTRMPTFALLLAIYAIINTSVNDVRAIFAAVGSYAFTWVEVLYVLGAIFAMTELLRVSKPGMDNTKEALAMAVVFVVYLILFVLGAVGTPALVMFATSEFLVLVLLNASQVVLAFMINARTLKRTIDTGDHA